MPFRLHTPVLAVAMISIAMGGAAAGGQEPRSEPEQTPPKVETGADIGGQAARPSDALLQPDPLEPVLEAVRLRPLQRWLSDHNFQFHPGFTFIWQGASDVQEDTDNLFSASFDLDMTWQIYEQPGSAGTVGLLVDGGQVIGHHQSEDLSANVGSSLGLNADADNEFVRIAELWYAQAVGEVVVIVIGKIDATNYFDTNRIANDETTQFISSPLVNNASIPFPDRGLGINASAKFRERFYATIGISDALSDENESGFNTVGDAKQFLAAEFGFTPTFRGLLGAYRFTWWRSELDGNSDTGVAFSVDQQIAPGIVPFARLGIGGEDLARFEYFASVGVGFENAFGQQDHLVAIGAAWGHTADTLEGSGESETIVETFYRFPLTDTVTLTPDVQMILNPIDSDGGVVLVDGARLQASF